MTKTNTFGNVGWQKIDVSNQEIEKLSENLKLNRLLSTLTLLSLKF